MKLAKIIFIFWWLIFEQVFGIIHAGDQKMENVAILSRAKVGVIMGEIKEYYEFCNRIKKAALNKEKVNIAIEVGDLVCSGDYKVEPVRENSDFFEIVAENMTFTFGKTEKTSVKYDDIEESYVITDGNYLCIVT